MPATYHMVFINVIVAFFLGLAILVFKILFPKKKLNLFFILTLITFLPIINIFRTGAYESGDFNIHIYRIMSFYDSLKEAQIMPSWAGELNATYGNPLFIFNYSLPYYIISFFHFIGLSFIGSTKLYLALTLLFSGIFMYFFIKELTGSKIAAFASGIFYVFSPYHLIDVHFRATLGESTIFMLVPLLFFFVTKFHKEGKLIFLVLISLITDLIFLAHPLLGIIFFLIAVLYTIFINFERNTKIFFYTILSLTFGAFASIYIWASFIIYSPYTFKLSTLTKTTDNIVFYPFNQLFFSPWRYGFLFQGPKGELAQIIGYTQIFVILISVIVCLISVNKKIKSGYIFWIFICLTTIFLMHPASKFFWTFFNNASSMITAFGRLSLVISFSTSIIAGYFVIVLSKKKTYLVYLLLIITIGYTILNWGHRRVIPEINDAVLRKNVWISTVYEGATAYFINSKWADKNEFWFSKKPSYPIEIIQGSGNVKQLKRTSVYHSYLLNAQTKITIRENTLYFPGWSLKSDNKLLKIYPDKKGRIIAELPKGKQYLEFSYEDILGYKILKIISLTSLIFLLVILFYYYLLKLRPTHNISPGK